MISKQHQKHVMIVAGESSGDLHGGHLVAALKEFYPQINCFGVGGRRMEQAGCRILFPSDELSVMGAVEVVCRLPVIFKRFQQLARILKGSDAPDVLVLIDFPDFNLRLAKVAKKVGVPVLYYISPKVWAWRPGRVKTIAARVDRLALIFPFEAEIYAPFKVQAEYVGNPLLDEFSAHRPRPGLRERLGLPEGHRVVGLFPGSRHSELKYIFDTLLKTAQQLSCKRGDISFVVPVAPSLRREELQSYLPDTGLAIHLVEETVYDVAAVCDAVVAVSGTVTLQLALTGTPMAIVYKLAPLSYAIGRRLVKVPFVGLPNIVAGEAIVREFIQDAADPEALCEEVLRLLEDKTYVAAMRDDLAGVRRILGDPGSARRVADMVAEMSGSIIEKRQGE